MGGGASKSGRPVSKIESEVIAKKRKHHINKDIPHESPFKVYPSAQSVRETESQTRTSAIFTAVQEHHGDEKRGASYNMILLAAQKER